jgi:hypothetical protein
MDRQSALASAACDAALVDGDLASIDGDEVAVVFGTTYGCHAVNEEYERGRLKGAPSPRLFTYTLPSSPTGEISIHYRLRGPCLTFASGGTAWLDALDAGLRLLRRRRARRVVVVGADVATPWLSRLLVADRAASAAANGLTIAANGLTISPTGALIDSAAALILERPSDACAWRPRHRGRVIACASGFVAGDRRRATAAAVEELLGATGSAGCRILGADGDVAHLASEAAVVETAAPLAEAARWLAGGRGTALLVAGDDAGAGAAALIESWDA